MEGFDWIGVGFRGRVWAGGMGYMQTPRCHVSCAGGTPRTQNRCVEMLVIRFKMHVILLLAAQGCVLIVYDKFGKRPSGYSENRKISVCTTDLSPHAATRGKGSICCLRV